MSLKRLLVLGALDPDYTRHAVILRGLEINGVELVHAHLPKNASTLRRIMHIMRNAMQMRNYDAIYIPAFNQLTGPLVWLIGRLSRRPVLMDYLTGLMDTLEDRGHAPRWKAFVYRGIDRFNLKYLDTMTDTQAHCDYFRKTLAIIPARTRVVPVGVREALLDELLGPPPDDIFIVQYLGTYIPFHSVDTILYAAQQLASIDTIHFELVGKGQTYAAVRQLAKTLGLYNVTFNEGYYKPPELFAILRRASVFLGVFGNENKTRYVVPSKVYEGMAMERPVITAESPALDEFFTPGEHFITVKPDDPTALADAILQLTERPELYDHVKANGTQRIQEAFLPRHIGKQVKNILDEIVG